MDAAARDRAAEILSLARLGRQPIGPLPEDCRPTDEAAGYAVQEAVHERLVAAGFGEPVGHKIGCTTPIMQAYLGIDSPCAGGVFAETVRLGMAVVRHADFVRPGVECEIAIRLAADLPADAAPFTRGDVAGAVGECMAAIELVDDRYADHRALGAPTLIADDFFGAGCVLGAPVSDWRRLDLAAAWGTTIVSGAAVGTATGASVMGHPFEALAWLANSMARRGRGLRAGEFVLTGSLVAVHWVVPGDVVIVAIEGLGEARARFE